MDSIIRLIASILASGLFVAAVADHPAIALDPERRLTQFHHTSWSAPEQAPSTVTIAQTPDGYLWIGGRALYRFDGIRAERFAADKIPDLGVTALVTDANGVLWVGLGNAMLARITPNEVTTYSVPTPKNRTPIYLLVPDPDGSMWIGTRDVVFNFNGSEWKQIDSPWPPATTYTQPGGVWTMELARDGTLWAKNLEGLFYLRRGSSTFEHATDYGPAGIGFARDKDGRVWTSDFRTNRFYALPDLTSEHPVPPPQVLGASVPPQIFGIIKFDRDGVLWNANRVTGGFHRLTSVTEPASVESFGTGRDPVLYFSTVFEDREGNIWTTDGFALHRFRSADIAVEDSLRFMTQASQLLSSQNQVYFYSGMNPPVDDPKGEGRRLYRLKPGIAPELVEANFGQSEAMAAAPDGSIIYAREGKLLIWQDGASREIETPSEIQGGHVVNIAATTNGFVVSVYDRGVWRFAAGVWTRLTPPNAPASGQPTVAVDKTGAIWFAYNAFNRIIRMAANGATEIPEDIGSELGGVSEILVSGNNVFFAGANGVARFDGNDFSLVSRIRLPVLVGCLDIAQSPDNYVWILCTPGIVRISEGELDRAFADDNFRPSYELFDSDDRFMLSPSGDVFGASMVSGPDGSIWFLNGRHVSWIDPARPYRNEQPPPVSITSIVAGGQAYDTLQPITLPQGSSQVEIDYTGLSLTVPEKMRFRYRLSGVDENWVDAGNRRQAFYTNLQPGEYRFQVIAANSEGVWNETGATVAFEIPPTFFQSIWFQLLLGAALAGLALLAYRVLLHQQAARLQNRFNIRIAERERIARELHDTLLQGFQGLMMRLQLVAKETPFESSIRHSIDDALKRADAALVEGRDRVRELRSEHTSGDLAQDIQVVAKNILDQAAPRFELEVHGRPRNLHALVGEELVRIAEEAIRNAALHANASLVSVTISYSGSLRLSIEDDGTGISALAASGEEKSGRYGLVGMRERATRIGAKLDIAMRAEGGTEVSVSLPSHTAYADPRLRIIGLFRSTKTSR